MKKMYAVSLSVLLAIFVFQLVFGQATNEKKPGEKTVNIKSFIQNKQPSSYQEYIECFPGATLSVPSTNFSNAYTSSADPAANYLVATPYTLSVMIVGGPLRFWGLRMYYNGGWAECFENPMEFDISLWNDDGGKPGTVQYSLTASATPTDIGETFAGFPLWQWDVYIPYITWLPCGWMSIQSTANNSDCWFLWVDAPDCTTMGTGLQWHDGAWGPLADPCPLGFCLNGGGWPYNDVGILQIKTPSTGVNLGVEAVKVSVSNFGGNSVSNIPLFYTVNGSAPVVETFAGPLAGATNADYTFMQTVDLSAPGTYIINACTDLPDDTNVSNDCKSKLVENQPPVLCAPTYTTGCSNGDGLTYFDIDGQYQNYTGCDNNTGYPGWSQYLDKLAVLNVWNFECTAMSGYSDQDLTVWVDFNDDLTFSPDEVIIDCFNLPSAGVAYTTQFTMPAGALPCQHLLRAMTNWQPTDPCPYNPCGSFTYGETEDYMVLIFPACVGTLEGYVYKEGTIIPVEGATIEMFNSSGTSNAGGFYQITYLPCCTGQATASHPDYGSQTITDLTIGTVTVQNFELPWIGITTVPDTATGYNELVGENQVLQTVMLIHNPGTCDLVYDITLTEISKSNEFLNWLWLDQYQGTVPAGGNDNIQVFFSAVGYSSGTVKTARMDICTNTPTPVMTMDVVMTVGAPPYYFVEGFVIEYNTMTPVSACIVNIDGGIMPPMSTTTNSSGHYEFSGLTGGYYEVSVAAGYPCYCNDVYFLIDTLTVPVNLYILCPEISADPQQLNVAIVQGQQKEENLLVFNPGSYELQYTSTINFISDLPVHPPSGSVKNLHGNITATQTGTDESWLSITDNSSGIVQPFNQTSVQMGLLFDATGLPAGTVKTAEIVINSTALSNPSLSVPVTMHVYEGKQLSLKVFLEGAFNPVSGIMDTTLSNSGLIPLAQPFNPSLPYYGNSAPVWYFQGNESVAGIGSGVVDWILIEIRDAADVQGATAATKELELPAFIVSDGSVVSLDFTSKPFVPVSISQGMFIVIHHRNHLSIINSEPIQEQGGTYTFDYTAGGTYGGPLGAKEVIPGVWAMMSGDGNADSQVNNADKVDVWAVHAGTSGYFPGDFNLDAQVNNTDKNELWAPNTGLGGQVPE
ncbi:MAG: carboxypeptidase regulatory-like domain-containing protein [Bacteroidales bacterium]|nr:carboxypeptidase regulatory-like domain-containing protein [Bacteroidales bacterium]